MSANISAALHNGQIDGEIAYFLRFLIATGSQRVRETLRLDWSEISLRRCLPAPDCM